MTASNPTETAKAHERDAIRTMKHVFYVFLAFALLLFALIALNLPPWIAGIPMVGCILVINLVFYRHVLLVLRLTRGGSDAAPSAGHGAEDTPDD